MATILEHLDDQTEYGTMCLKIAQELTAEDLKNIMFILRDKIRKATAEKIKDGKDLLTVLERQDFFSKTNVTKLEKLLSDAGISALASVVKEYIVSRNAGRCYDTVDSTQNYATYSMTVVQNFVETDNYRKMEQKIDEKGAVLIKGPPGCGKSQTAFYYARKFHRKNKHSIVWRIHCKSDREMHLSYANLLLRLGIREVIQYQENCIKDCIKKMFDRVYKQLISGEYLTCTHLIIMDDMESPNVANDVHEMMEHFIIAKNIHVIGTSQNRFSPMLTHNYGLEMSKMKDEEVIQLFKLDNNMSDATEIDEVKKLAIKLDYLPLCLALASSYIRITKTSIATYNINWSELQEQAHDISEKGKNFDASFILTLEKLEKDLPANAKSLLKYIPHINYNVIPIQLLESLVESDSTSKVAVVNRLLTVLHDYSLATISGAGESRIVSIHSVTVWFLDKKKTQDEKYAEKQFLLKHFCYHIDNDARLVEVMNRNVKFLDHACCLLKSLEKYRTENIEAQLFECYLYCSVAVTFQLYGNTQVSADYFFKKAKNLICEMISCTKVGIESPHTCATYMESDDINDLLFGDSVIQAKSKELFRVLTRKSREIPIEVVKNFVLKKIRSNRDMRLIKEYGNYTDNEFPNNQITERCFEKLTEQNVVLSMDDVQEIFLAELLITILYNHSKNIVFIAEANEAEKTFDYGTIEQTPYINSEAILEFQISLNLARHVENFLCESPYDLHSVRYVLTKRGGINHFLNKVRNEKVIKSIIKEMTTMQTDCEENRYFDFGVLKMSRNYNLYQRCMIQNILRKCYLDLSHISPIQVEYNIKQALHHTEELEKILSQMEPWLALTNIHLDIAETYMVLVSPHAEKAKNHFRMALAKPGPTSRYKLKAYQSFIKFCYQQGKDDDFEIAEHFGKEVLLQSREEEQKEFVRKFLQNLRDKISKPTSPVPDHELTTDSQIFEGSETGVIEGESINLMEESMFQTTATVQQHGNITSGNVLGTSVENPDSESSSRKTTDNKKDKHKTLSSFEERIFVKLDALESLQRELIEIERARLTIEREKIEIERNRFELEKQKLEVEMNK